MNATIEKFGYPASLVADYAHWVVLARPTQITLGSLVLAAKSDCRAFGDLPPAAFVELGQVIAAIEGGLRSFVEFERINYLMLMMVDPHVHCHVIPRYPSSRGWGGIELADFGWPGPPDLGSGTSLSEREIDALAGELRLSFSSVVAR